LPTSPAPAAGDHIRFVVGGLPPYKDLRFSIRNPKHSCYQRFVDLRRAAVIAMNGRAWYLGPIGFELTLYCQTMERTLGEFAGGIADTLDGSHGMSFTYLPIVYQDDCQIEKMALEQRSENEASYELKIDFL
jgi:hypothetical protein